MANTCRTALIAVIALCLVVAAPALAEDENEQPLKLEQLPAAVKAAIQKEIGATQPDEIEKKTAKDGKVVYEVEWHTDTIRAEAAFGEDGKLLSRTVVTRPEKVDVDKLPESVRKALVDSGGKDVRSVVKQSRNDKVFYKAEWKADGREVEVVLGADGKVLAKAEELPADQLPEAVKTSVKKELGENKVAEAERITRGDSVVYKVEWKTDGKEAAAVFAADGKLLSREAADDDDDDGEGEDDD